MKTITIQVTDDANDLLLEQARHAGFSRVELWARTTLVEIARTQHELRELDEKRRGLAVKGAGQ